VTAEKLTHLTRVSHALDELLNRAPDRHAPYVGASAFATKAGIHASAVMTDPRTYEHVAPESVGNRRRVLVSDQAGKSNIIAELGRLGVNLEKDDQRLSRLLDEVKDKEAQGYAYEGADASFFLLAKRVMARRRIISTSSVTASRWIAASRATAASRTQARGHRQAARKRRNAHIGGGGQWSHQRARSRVAQGPWQLSALYRGREARRLPRARVSGRHRRGDARAGRMRDGKGERWSTVGVSANVIDASFEALVDAIVYKLLREGAK